MGIYRPKHSDAPELSDGEQDSLEKKEGRGLPGIHVEHADDINDDLDENALPHEFVGVPIYTFVDHNLADDIQYKACKYCRDTVDYRRHLSTTSYQDFTWLKRFVSEPLAEGLGVPYSTLEGKSFD